MVKLLLTAVFCNKQVVEINKRYIRRIMKKLTVVGKGIVGALAVAHFLKYTDWDID
jgi:uncharacterized protein (UPF0333 family)